MDDVFDGAHLIESAGDIASGQAGHDESSGALPEVLAPEPDWVRAAADDRGWTWVRIAWQRARAHPGTLFDADRAEHVVRQWPKMWVLTEDRFEGKPFVLTEWQACIVRLVFGFYRKVEEIDPVTHKPTVYIVRFFRQLDLWIARRNGKTTFLAALAATIFLLTPTANGRGFNFAHNEEQARLLYDTMTAMIAASPWAKDAMLQKRHFVIANASAKRSIWRVLPGTPKGKHGRGPSVIAGDEIHEWKSRELQNTLHQGTGSRIEPFEAYASTAGPRSARVGHDFYRESIGVLEGRINEPFRLVAHFVLDPEADWREEANWRIANPNVGLSPTMDYLRGECAKAQVSAAAELKFRCYHLNQWVDESLRWLRMKDWDACKGAVDWRQLPTVCAGQRAYLGWDISKTRDFTALAAIIPNADDTMGARLAVRLWLPEERVAERARTDPMFEQWVRLGAIETTAGDTVDQNAVLRAVVEWCELFDVAAIGFDRFESQKLLTDLQEMGIDPDLFVKVPMAIALLSKTTQAFERMVFSHQLAHGGNPVLRWMAGNTDIRFDSNMNYMPSKKHSEENIDGIMAAVIAAHQYLNPGEDNIMPASAASVV